MNIASWFNFSRWGISNQQQSEPPIKRIKVAHADSDIWNEDDDTMDCENENNPINSGIQLQRIRSRSPMVVELEASKQLAQLKSPMILEMQQTKQRAEAEAALLEGRESDLGANNVMPWKNKGNKALENKINLSLPAMVPFTTLPVQIVTPASTRLKRPFPEVEKKAPDIDKRGKLPKQSAEYVPTFNDNGMDHPLKPRSTFGGSGAVVQPLPPPPATTSLSGLIRNLSVTSLSIQSDISKPRSTDKKAIVAKLKESIADIEMTTEMSVNLKREMIQEKCKAIQRYDPMNRYLKEVKTVLAEVDEVYAMPNPSGPRLSRKRGSNILSSWRNKDEMVRHLNNTLWHAEKKASILRQLLDPLLDKVKAENRRIALCVVCGKIAESWFIPKVISEFFELPQLLAARTICRRWKDVIGVDSLLLCIQRCYIYPQERFELWIRSSPCLLEYGLYQTLLLSGATRFDNDICRDTKRTTFFDVPIPCRETRQCLNDFHSWQQRTKNDDITEKQRRLENLLKAYCTLEPDVGYCQGMTFLGAALLSCTAFHEEKAFLLFTMAMRHYAMNDIFRPGLEGTKVKFIQLENLCQEFLPEVYKEFQKHEIHPIMYASGWIMTLFTNETTLPPSFIIHILDRFFTTGWKGLFSIILGLLKALQPRLVHTSMDNILRTLTNISKLQDPTIIQRILHESEQFNTTIPDKKYHEVLSRNLT